MIRTSQIRRRESQAGFSLIELMIAIALLMVIAGATTYALNYFTKNSSSTQLKADVNSGLRGALEMMTQDLTQAGLLNSTDGIADTTLATADLSSGNPQAISVANASLFYSGEYLTIWDSNPLYIETVQVTAVDTTNNKITAIFGYNHNVGTPIYAAGVIPNGLISARNAGGAVGGTNTNGTILDLVGDFNADGSLQYVEYVCDKNNTQQLLRAAVPVSQGTIKSSDYQPILSSVTNCNFSATDPNSTGYNTRADFWITVQTARKDPQTGQYLSITKSILDVYPRNVAGAVALSSIGQYNTLQPLPASLPSSLY